MDGIIDETLLVRSLNVAKPYYFPSYLGLRLIGDQLPKGDTDYLQHTLIRRLNAGDQWRFKKYSMYKGSQYSEGNLQHEYRDCLCPSPLTAICESLILQTMAINPEFAVHPRVYSYHWATSSRAGSSYQFFSEGYRKRNFDISAALSENDQVAVITDIKSFYPSVDKNKLSRILREKPLKNIERDKLSGEAVLNYFDQLLSQDVPGIPIGPASSHVLGHLAMRDIDDELSRKYGNKYFRYVDDIVVVCNKNDMDAVANDIDRCISENGFFLNTSKTAFADYTVWNENMMSDDISHSDSFRKLCKDLGIYLSFFPDRVNSLREMFSNNGLSIPINRISALSNYSRYRKFLGWLLYQKGKYQYLAILLSNNDAFVKRAIDIKATHESSAVRLLNEKPSDVPNIRRWQIQRMRRVINPLFYLREFGEWSDVGGLLSEHPEFIEQRALASALKTGNADPVLPYYGRGPAAFSELWVEYGKSIATIGAKSNYSDVEVDGISTLLLQGAIQASQVDLLHESKACRMLRLAGGLDRDSRKIPDLSFEDEIGSLMLGATNEKLKKLSMTRHSSSEYSGLDALSLLAEEYRS